MIGTRGHLECFSLCTASHTDRERQSGLRLRSEGHSHGLTDLETKAKSTSSPSTACEEPWSRDESMDHLNYTRQHLKQNQNDSKAEGLSTLSRFALKRMCSVCAGVLSLYHVCAVSVEARKGSQTP